MDIKDLPSRALNHGNTGHQSLEAFLNDGGLYFSGEDVKQTEANAEGEKEFRAAREQQRYCSDESRATLRSDVDAAIHKTSRVNYSQRLLTTN